MVPVNPFYHELTIRSQDTPEVLDLSLNDWIIQLRIAKMKNTKIIVSNKDFRKYRGSLAVILVDEQENISSFLDKQIKWKIKKVLGLGDFKGKNGQSLLLYPDSSGSKGSLAAQRLLLVGIGKTKDIQRSELLEALRISGGVIAQTALKTKTTDIMVALPDYLETVPVNGAEQIVEGILLGDYQFLKYKKSEKPEESPPGIKKIPGSSGNI